jgi:micrococcal nuclease
MSTRPDISPRKTPKQWRSRRRLHLCSAMILLFAAGVSVRHLDRMGTFGTANGDDIATYHNVTARVVRVVDGDTIDIAIPDGDRPHTRIRLWGVDTPETVRPNSPVQHFGPEASAFAKKTLHDQPVKIELPTDRTRGKYGRLLAYIYLPDGRLFNALLIETGHGYADPRFRHPKMREFKGLMKQAKKDGTGLWAKPNNPDLPKYLKRR